VGGSSGNKVAHAHVRIVVCIKHVANIDEALIPRFAPGTPNDLDLNAIEEALRLRAAAGGEVVALTVGPPASDASLRKALMMGADRVVRLWGSGLDEADSSAMAMVLGKAVRKMGFDLLLCGARSADTSSEVIGALLAQHLQLPLVTRALGLRLADETGKIVTDRKLERGERETYRVPLPAVITIERGGPPRYASPRWVHRMVHGRVETLTPEEIGLRVPLPAPRVKTLALTAPKTRTKIGVKVSGLSLKEKMAVMRGQAGGSQRRMVTGTEPAEAAKKIMEHLELWLK
jgi:electron transfer flavoprotein beta subunit